MMANSFNVANSHPRFAGQANFARSNQFRPKFQRSLRPCLVIDTTSPESSCKGEFSTSSGWPKNRLGWHMPQVQMKPLSCSEVSGCAFGDAVMVHECTPARECTHLCWPKCCGGRRRICRLFQPGGFQGGLSYFIWYPVAVLQLELSITLGILDF